MEKPRSMSINIDNHVLNEPEYISGEYRMYFTYIIMLNAIFNTKHSATLFIIF